MDDSKFKSCMGTLSRQIDGTDAAARMSLMGGEVASQYYVSIMFGYP
jgi:hypothetical protein